jgi:hypothetical protein
VRVCVNGKYERKDSVFSRAACVRSLSNCVPAAWLRCLSRFPVCECVLHCHHHHHHTRPCPPASWPVLFLDIHSLFISCNALSCSSCSPRFVSHSPRTLILSVVRALAAPHRKNTYNSASLTPLSLVSACLVPFFPGRCLSINVTQWDPSKSSV